VLLVVNSTLTPHYLLYEKQLMQLTKKSDIEFIGEYEHYQEDNENHYGVSLIIRKEFNPDTHASWISITNAVATYDYSYEPAVMNPRPTVLAGEYQFQVDDLYSLKQYWGFDQTSYLPNQDAQKGSAFNRLTNSVSHYKLVPKLSAKTFPQLQPTAVEDVPEAMQAQFGLKFGSVYKDPAGGADIKIGATGKVKSTVNRFIYKLGQSRKAGDTLACGANRDQTCGPDSKAIPEAYYADFMQRWFVDLYDGVLYDDSSYPTGTSLFGYAHLDLLNKLQVAVKLDTPEPPTPPTYAPIGLRYRFATSE
jgi:hypothetical protein